MKYDMKYLGARIREERKKRKLTIEQLAESIDLSSGFLTNVELGSKGISIEKLIDIANYFNLIIDDLLNINKQTPSFKQEKLIELTRDMPDDKFEILIGMTEVLIKPQLTEI